MPSDLFRWQRAQKQRIPSTATAASHAGRLPTGVRRDPYEPLVDNTLGEITNVIAGQVKTPLVGTPHHFDLSAPTIGVAAASLWPPPGRDGVMISFTTDAGEVVLHFFP
jgi:CheY-specific phosphatase CheX